jgi:hypothetical protein
MQQMQERLHSWRRVQTERWSTDGGMDGHYECDARETGISGMATGKHGAGIVGRRLGGTCVWRRRRHDAAIPGP